MGKRTVKRVGGSKQAWLLAEEAYKQGRPLQPVPYGLEFLTRTPTEVAYRDPATGTIYIGVRGTTDIMDVLTWPLVPVGLLPRTSRYKRARAFAASVASQYPLDRIEVSGHSLGGTIASQLQRELGDRVARVETYNQAAAPADLYPRDDIVRHYAQDDPLYQYFGGKLTANTEMHPPAQQGVLGSHTNVFFAPVLAAQLRALPRAAPPSDLGSQAGRALAAVNQGLSYLGVPGTAEGASVLYRRYGGRGRRPRGLPREGKSQ